MNPAELARHDLNLLVMLHVLIRERHVSRAAEILNVSQPTLSRSLARLREMFGDQLLVRSGHEMMPTPRALDLFPQIEALIQGVATLVRPSSLDLATVTRTVRVVAPDLVVYMLVPELTRTLAAEAPGLDLELVPWSASWREAIEKGAIDLSVGIPVGTEPGIYSRPLIEAHWVCLLRQGHPALAGEWTLERFAGLHHLQMAIGPGGGQIDAALAERGLSRRIALRIPYPVLAPLIVAETDLVLTTSDWLACKLAVMAGLALRPLPVDAAPIRASMVWHERTHGDPLHQWIRGTIIRVAQEIYRRSATNGEVLRPQAADSG